MDLLLVLGLAGTAFCYWDDSVWAPKWIMLSFWASFWISSQIIKKFHWSAGLPIISVLISTLWISESRMHQYRILSSIDQVALREVAARGGMSFIIVVLAVFLMQRRHYIIMEKFLGFFCLCDAIVVIYQAMQPGIRPFYIGGILGNASMNGCALAFLYPFLVWRADYEKMFPIMGGFRHFVKEFASVWLPPIAIFCSQSTMAIATLFMVFFSFFWSQYQVRLRTLLLVGLMTLLISYKFIGPDFLNTSGRWLIWKTMMGHFWHHGNLLVGSGTGSAQVLIPYFQSRFELNTDNNVFLWLHSDVLQVFFEQGALGLISFSVATFFALRRVTFSHPYIFASLVGWLMTASANYPARMAFHAFVGAFLYAVALRKDPDDPTNFDFSC